MKIHGTAKGAALSTKDFGVAFGKAEIPLVTIYEHTTAPNVDAYFNGSSDTHGGLSITAASPVGIIGSVPRKVTFYLKKYGTPTVATMTARVTTCSDETDVKIQYDTLSTASITTSYQEFEFNNSTTTYELQDGDAVVLIMGLDVYPDYFGAGGTNPDVGAGQKLAIGSSAPSTCTASQTMWIKLVGIEA
jgi:hypothetical protein